MLDDVITVTAAGAGLEQRRQIAVAYSQLIQIGYQSRCLPQIEITVQLQPVSRSRDPQFHTLRGFAPGRARHAQHRPLLAQRG